MFDPTSICVTVREASVSHAAETNPSEFHIKSCLYRSAFPRLGGRTTVPRSTTLHFRLTRVSRPDIRHCAAHRQAHSMASAVLNKPYRFILVSDLDWTLVDHNDKENTSLHAFNKLWETQFAKDCLLVFSTGRSLKLYNELREEVPLGNPDILICSVGTEIFFEKPGSDGTEPQPDKKWIQLLDQGWNRQAALAAAAELQELKPQSESEQRPHKLSYHVTVKAEAGEKVVKALEDKLQSAGVQAKVIYSGGEDLDILPQHASKGKGLEFLLGEVKELVGAPKDGVLVNGDSGNDIELFAVPGVRGCMVQNAHPELKKWCDENKSPNLFQASKRCAGGILEALQHFNLAQQ